MTGCTDCTDCTQLIEVVAPFHLSVVALREGVAELYGDTGVPVLSFGVSCVVGRLDTAVATDDLGSLQWIPLGSLNVTDYFGKQQGNGVTLQQYLKWLCDKHSLCKHLM